MSKSVMILERSSQNLKKIDDGSKTVLEGVFAEFGKENRNGRIYEEKEYLPHLEYLKKDIKSGNLLGELDHPERFEVSLGKVSHRITELWYDQQARQVKGKIEILEGTPNGLIAKELLKAGIPLSISSRAAGTVNENKTVSIQQIYTYDLVAKPGFENAQLHSVNESARPRIHNLIQKLNESHNEFESQVSDIKSDLGIINENLSIYDIADKFPTPQLREEARRIANVKNKNEFKPMNENQNLNDDALQQWTAFVKTELSKINERLDGMEDAILNGGGGSSKDVKILKGYANKLRETIESHLDWTGQIAKSVNKLGRYSDNLAKKSNEHFEKTQKIEETIDYNAKVLNNTIDWVGENAKVTNAIAETVDYNANMLNQMNEWTEEIAKGVNALNEWGEEKAQAINGIHEWTSSIAKGLNETANWSEEMFGRAMSKKDAQKLVQYIELVGEGKNNPELKEKINEVLNTHGITGKTVNENIKGISVIDAVKPVGSSKTDVDAGKATGVEFDGKTIVAKIKKSGFSKSDKPKELKTIEDQKESGSLQSSGKVKGVEIIDSTKVVNQDKSLSGGEIKSKDQNLKLDIKPEGKLKEGQQENKFDKASSIKERQSKLDEKLAKIIDTLEKEKEKVNETKQEFPFASLLSDSDQKSFSDLSKSDKEKVANAIKKNPTNDSETIKALWENALKGEIKEEPKWIAAAPPKYKKLYEEADERTKAAIEAKSEFFQLETQYQINNFWETSGIAPSVLNEVFVPGKESKEVKEDEVDSYIKSIGNYMKERFNS